MKSPSRPSCRSISRNPDVCRLRETGIGAIADSFHYPQATGTDCFLDLVRKVSTGSTSESLCCQKILESILYLFLVFLSPSP